MFTGIIEETGVLRSIRRGVYSAQLEIGAEKIINGSQVGDSIAVNGVCLTAVRFSGRVFVADVMAETLARSNLGILEAGDKVNLERALRLGDRLGGHFVSGHIDGVGVIEKLERRDIATLYTVGAPPEVMRYIVRKGSVAIDGISLTVVDFSPGCFQVSLIPHTAHATTLSDKNTGDTVNLEGDLVGKYIERLMNFQESNERKSNVNMDFLAVHGFI